MYESTNKIKVTITTEDLTNIMCELTFYRTTSERRKEEIKTLKAEIEKLNKQLEEKENAQ